MKRKGPELGDLSARFFAYVQLKKKDIVRTGELSAVLGISELQERDLLSRLSTSGWIVRLKRGVYLVPLRIPAGGKYSPGFGPILQKLITERGGLYQVCGPTAFNYYGFVNQIPNVTYVYNTCISGSRTIGNLAFSFIKVTKKRLGGTTVVDTREGTGVIYSSKVRTLMDAVYDWSRFNSLPQGYNWIRQEISLEPGLAVELIKVTIKYGNQATVRRIGCLLEMLNLVPDNIGSLSVQRSDSKALIISVHLSFIRSSAMKRHLYLKVVHV